tara:strand:+ start:3834 stop:4682 length:849 start_codon:yes stop_codon:yes gene_type:complete
MKNLFILLIVIVIVVLILNHYFFKSNVIYDGMLTAQTYAGGMSAQVEASNPYKGTPGVPAKIILPDGNHALFYNTALGKTGKIVDNSKFPVTSSNNFMYSVWFFIDEYNTNLSEFKIISSIIGLNNSTQFISTLDLVLTPYNNNLIVGITTTSSSTSTLGTPYYSIYYVENIPLQKWNCLIISVTDRTLDIYLEGKLVNSFILESFYMAATNQTLYLGNNSDNFFKGYITRARYQAGGISPQEAYNIYKEGISSSSFGDFFNKYRLRVGLYEYGNQINSFEI